MVQNHKLHISKMLAQSNKMNTIYEHCIFFDILKRADIDIFKLLIYEHVL